MLNFNCRKLELLYVLLFYCCFGCVNFTNNNVLDKRDELEVVNNKVFVNSKVIRPLLFQKQIIANGKIAAQQKSELRFKTTERITSIKVKNGENVSKGQTLAVLDNAILLNQLHKAEIEFDKAKSKLQEDKINYSIKDSVSITVLKELQIKSGYLDAQNALENAQLLYNQTILEASFDGIVANIETNTGNYITSSDVFCVLIGQQHLEVVFSVLENEFNFINKNQDVLISSFVNEEKTYKGVITEINPIVNENGLIQIKAKINTPDTTLFEGMHVKVVINQPLNDVIVVPKEALVLRSNREVVFTVENGLAKWNYVEVLDENSMTYAVKKGLKLGDTIIISGNMNLSHDAKVNATFLGEQEASK